MPPKSIRLFMWGYQPHFRSLFEHRMNDVMSALGVPESGVECLLVGARIPGRQNPNNVCLEPEDGKWSVDLFDRLLELIEEEVATHPDQNIIYTDAPTMEDKPENIRRDSVRISVQKLLKRYDSENDVRSFAGPPAPVDDFYVVPVLQLPTAIFQHFRPLREPIKFNIFTGHPSLIHAAVSEVLAEAHDELLRPDPGRRLIGRTKSSQEIIVRAGESFMRTPGLAIGDRNFGNPNLLERFNAISSLMYEGTKGTGKLILANPDGGAVDFHIRFAEPIPFREHRWSRKALQMASPQTSLVADCQQIYGLGGVASGVDPCSSQNVFEIEFLDHYVWQLRCGSQTLLVSNYGTPSLPQQKFPRDRLLDTFQRLFPEAGERHIDRFTALFAAAVGQRHGSMLIVASDAEPEADRLQGQGTRIEPTTLTPELYRQVSGVDGAVLVDPQGICFAIGVILDGPATSDCTPSRGARYNSGIRYIGSSSKPRLAIVVSDDKTVDVIPVLRPRIRRSQLEQAISLLEAANLENYHSHINWLDRHRFYVDQEQCNRINAVLERIGQEPLEVGEFRVKWPEFIPDPSLDESYFEDEDPNSVSPYSMSAFWRTRLNLTGPK